MTSSEISVILQAIARVEEQIKGIQRDNEKADEVHKDHETRIRAAEKFRYLLAGALALIGGGAGGLVSKLF